MQEWIERFRDWLERVREHRLFRPIAGGTVAVLCLAIGGWLIAGYIASIPPDPANDDPERVIAYFMSDHFDNLSEAERQAYIRAMLEQYAAMDAEQRELVSDALRDHRDSDSSQVRERMIEMWRDYAVSEAQQYVELPADERREWLNRRMGMWQMMAGGDSDRMRGGGGNRDRERERDMALTEERQERAMEFFRDEVLTRSTGRDRAVLMVMMEDLRGMDWD